MYSGHIYSMPSERHYGPNCPKLQEKKQKSEADEAFPRNAIFSGPPAGVQRWTT